MFDFRLNPYVTPDNVFGYNYAGSGEFKKRQIKRKRLVKQNRKH